MELIIILYLVNFIRTIIIIVAIYFALKLFTRYVLPLILENKIRQMQQNMNERSRNQRDGGKKEGEVTIDYNSPNKNKSRSQNEGEYVDFEEVD
jgi:hypothetical protein